MGPQEIICCFIPECSNTSQIPTGKRFARVPCLPKLRQLWIKSGLRLKIKVPIVDRSPMYCCEDHFDLKYDATRQWLLNDQHYDNGHFIKLKRGVLPHVFPSRQKNNAASKTSKKISSTSDEKKLVIEELNCLIKEEPDDYNEFNEEQNPDELGDHSQDPEESLHNVSLSKDSNESDVKESTANTDAPAADSDVNQGEAADKSDEQGKTVDENSKTNKKISEGKSVQKSLGGKKVSDKENVENKNTQEDKNYEKEKNKIGTSTNREDCAEEVFDKNLDINEGKTENDQMIKEEKCVKHEENSLKRKISCDDATIDNSKGETEKDAAKKNNLSLQKKKKRKVVKEILAWIPSDPSVVPQLRTPNGMQPFIVVQTPPSTPGTTPILQLPSQQTVNGAPSVTSVPLAAGKETQFILTVPDKFPLVGPNGQQLVLAVPQGCSFSVDKLPSNGASDASKDQGATASTTATPFLLSSTNIVASVPNITSTSGTGFASGSNIIPANDTPTTPAASNNTGSISDHNYKLPDQMENTSKVSSQILNDTLKKSKQKRKSTLSGSKEVVDNLSEVAVVATTPVAPPTFKIAATPCLIASQPSSNCTCSASGTTKRSFVDTTELFDGSDKLSSSLQLVVDEFTAMKRAVTNLTKELQSIKTENSRLKTHNRILLEQKNAPPQPEETRKLELAADALKGIFTPNQIRILLGPRNDKGRVKWTDSEMDMAYDLSRISTNAYKYVLNVLKYPFPSITTLKRYIEKISDDDMRGTLENHSYLTDDFGMEDITTEDDALTRAILDADSEEELERDEGAIRLMEEMERKKKIKRIMDLDYSPERRDVFFKDVEKICTVRRVSIDKSCNNEIEKRIVKIDPQRRCMNEILDKHDRKEGSGEKHKVTRVSVPHSSAIKQLLSEDVILNHQKQIIQPNVTPRVVIIPKTKDKTQSAEIKDGNSMVGETIRIKKEPSADDVKDNLIIRHQLLTPPPSENKSGKKIVKLPVAMEKLIPSDKFLLIKQENEFTRIEDNSINPESLSSDQILIIENPDQNSLDNNVERHIEASAGELIISPDNDSAAYNETNFEPMAESSQGIVSNVAEFVESDGSSKMIRIQVEPMQGEDGMLYEEVVIHCDDPEIFNGSGALTFQEDAIEGSSFL